MYRETIQRIGVRFVYRYISFYERRQQTFDAEKTRKECGETCSEDDEVIDVAVWARTRCVDVFVCLYLFSK